MSRVPTSRRVSGCLVFSCFARRFGPTGRDQSRAVSIGLVPTLFPPRSGPAKPPSRRRGGGTRMGRCLEGASRRRGRSPRTAPAPRALEGGLRDRDGRCLAGPGERRRGHRRPQRSSQTSAALITSPRLTSLRASSTTARSSSVSGSSLSGAAASARETESSRHCSTARESAPPPAREAPRPVFLLCRVVGSPPGLLRVEGPPVERPRHRRRRAL